MQFSFSDEMRRNIREGLVRQCASLKPTNTFVTWDGYTLLREKHPSGMFCWTDGDLSLDDRDGHPSYAGGGPVEGDFIPDAVRQ